MTLLPLALSPCFLRAHRKGSAQLQAEEMAAATLQRYVWLFSFVVSADFVTSPFHPLCVETCDVLSQQCKSNEDIHPLFILLACYVPNIVCEEL